MLSNGNLPPYFFKTAKAGLKSMKVNSTPVFPRLPVYIIRPFSSLTFLTSKAARSLYERHVHDWKTNRSRTLPRLSVPILAVSMARSSSLVRYLCRPWLTLSFTICTHLYGFRLR